MFLIKNVLKLLPDLNWYCERTLGLSSPVRKALMSGGLRLKIIKDREVWYPG